MTESPEDFHRRTGMQGGDFARFGSGLFKLEIALGNAAMSDPGQIADALRQIARQLDTTAKVSSPILDLNGNVVGSYWMVDR